MQQAYICCHFLPRPHFGSVRNVFVERSSVFQWERRFEKFKEALFESARIRFNFRSKFRLEVSNEP